MNEFPVFVPFGDEHLAAVISLPEHGARGLVLLLPGGGGAPRSHRFSMWTKAARDLADRGVASVRLDWRGVGDSTGDTAFGFDRLPAEDVVAVARFAMRVTGISRLGVAGNCMGARTLLLAAPKLPTVESVVLMLIKPLARPRGKSGLVVKSKEMVKRLPVAPLARKLFWHGRQIQAAPILRRIVELRERSHVLLMESLGSEKTGNLPRVVESLRATDGHHRLELRDLPGGERRAFHRLERQRFMIESVVEWFDETLPPLDGHGAVAGNDEGETRRSTAANV